MAAAAKAFVVLLAGLQQAAGDVHATLISQSVSGPVTVHMISPHGHMDGTGNMAFYVDVATGAYRLGTDVQFHFRGMTGTGVTVMIYDPETGDMTISYKVTTGGMRHRERCFIRPAARGYQAVNGEMCHGPPVDCMRRSLRSLHYGGERHGDYIFHEDVNRGGAHEHIEFELNAWTRTIAAEHVSMTRGPSRFTFDWVVTHSHAGAPSRSTFHVPAAWGHCKPMDSSELEALPEMSTPVMEAVAGIEESYEMAAELVAASSDDASPAYLTACAGFALGALSASVVALAVAALQRRRRVSVAAITEPLANAA